VVELFLVLQGLGSLFQMLIDSKETTVDSSTNAGQSHVKDDSESEAHEYDQRVNIKMFF
jgi:hypothetical protein